MSSPKPVDLSKPGAGTTSNAEPMAVDRPRTPTPQPRYSMVGALHVLSKEQESILYHGDDVISKPVEKDDQDEDDSFYEVEVTLDDVKSMFKGLQRQRESLEDAPLKGKKLRELEKEKAILNSLHDHPNTLVRIRFPDRLILQGIFRTSETIGTLKTWIRQSLANPALDFYLFTAPPKKVLSDDVKLVDEGLVAMVVIYFGSSAMPQDNKVFKPDLYQKLSDPEKAFEYAKSKLKTRKREEQDDGKIRESTETQVKDHSGAASSGQQPVRRPVDKGKVPKWFKMK